MQYSLADYDYLRNVVIFLDYVLIFNFWTTKYHYLLWKKTNDSYARKGIDTVFKPDASYFSKLKYIKNMFYGFKNAIILTLILFLRPSK